MAISRTSQTKQMKCGGKAKKMKKGGLVMKGCGAATRGRKFSRNG